MQLYQKFYELKTIHYNRAFHQKFSLNLNLLNLLETLELKE